MNNEQEAGALLELSTEELHGRLGQALRPIRLGSAPPDPNQLRLDGKGWLQKQRKQLQDLVCRSEKVKKLMSEDKESRRGQLAVTVADILSAKLIGVPVLTVAVLLVKEGLHQLCKDAQCG